MYSDPCMALREYIQNSSDSIDEGIEKDLITFSDSKIEIFLDGKNRKLIIEDNGAGVQNSELEKKLGGLGLSNKEGAGLRGFRGIGRLGGLSYCDTLIFETRSKGDKNIGVVQWNGNLLRNSMEVKGIKSLSEVISKIAQISFRKASEKEPKHFFRVTMLNVSRFHTDRLTSIDVITQYLLRVAPLPFDSGKFSWSSKINEHLKNFPGYCTHNIFLNGKKLFNAYQDEFLITDKKKDRISNVDLIEFRAPDGSVFGKGWIARTSFLGGLPKAVLMRGVSVRQGNIEIGNEEFLADYFTERRFAAWHIGSFHLDYTLRPNARRDGFEESINYEKLLEQMTVLGKQMSKACRSASFTRYANQDLEHSLAVIERFLRGGIFVDDEHFQSTFRKVNLLVSDLETNKVNKNYPHIEKRLVNLRKQLGRKNKKVTFISDLIDRKQIKRVQQTKLLELTCRAIIRNIKHDGLSKKLLSDVLSPFVKRKNIKRDFALISNS